jgi:hypothetical protein
MEGTADAELVGIIAGKSGTGNPKLTLKFTILDELSDNPAEATTIGATCLETCSLQPQALFNINNYYKQVKGEDIPDGEHTAEDFLAMMSEALLNTRWRLDLKIGQDQNGNDRTQIAKAAVIG